MIKDYYFLTKPGIIRGNLITAAAGFFFASYGDVDWWLLLATLLGTTLIIASACVINNYIDRGIDAKMARTKKRALVTGSVSIRNAMIYATMLGLAGFLLLAIYVNILTLLLGAIAYAVYIIFYGLAKRRSVYGTIVGSIPGAIPVAAGYTAVIGEFDTPALILFLILVFWQMPHFYSIAIYRLKEYKAAKIPVLPIVRGIRATKFQIMIFIVGFVAATTMLATQGYAGKTYLAVLTATGFFWLWYALKGFYVEDDTRWARQMFGLSLIVLMIFSAMISIDNFLP